MEKLKSYKLKITYEVTIKFSDFKYTKEYFINWGKNLAEKSIESLREDLKSISDIDFIFSSILDTYQ